MNNALFHENKKLTENNRILKNECDSFKSRISDLDLNLKLLNSKYDSMSNNVVKFNKGKEDLDNLLSFQKPLSNKFGLGFNSKSKLNCNIANSYSNINIGKQNHALLYSKFVKSNNMVDYAKYNDSMHALDNRNVSKYSNLRKSCYLWIPKNLCMNDRNVYISNFKRNVVNSENYISHNIGKPNSYWVWFPKV
jgi:hypothetical protein